MLYLLWLSVSLIIPACGFLRAGSRNHLLRTWIPVASQDEVDYAAYSQRLLEEAAADIAPADLTRNVFCNVELNCANLEAVGFDMDFTLAQVRICVSHY